jgi:hypothetical protein
LLLFVADEKEEQLVTANAGSVTISYEDDVTALLGGRIIVAVKGPLEKEGRSNVVDPNVLR